MMKASASGICLHFILHLAAFILTLSEAKTPRHEDGLEDDLARHLRLPLAPVCEGDRDFRHAQALALRAEDRLDQEGVAFGGDTAFEQAAERAPRVAAEAARRVARAQPCDDSDVVVCD